jgi:hypothetical protein
MNIASDAPSVRAVSTTARSSLSMCPKALSCSALDAELWNSKRNDDVCDFGVRVLISACSSFVVGLFPFGFAGQHMVCFVLLIWSSVLPGERRAQRST